MTKYVVPFVGAALLLGFVACATGSVAPDEDLDAGGPATVDAGSDTGTPIPLGYSVGGTVSGLAGAGLVLQNNGGDDLLVKADSSFLFPTSVATGKPFNITVKTQPTSLSQTCTVANGSGTMGSASVTNATVTCVTTTFTVGGVVNGMTGTGLVLQNNGAGDLAINSNGPFNFAAPQNDGSTFAVSVKTDPSNPGQTCLVAGGTGTIAGGNISTVNVNCSKKKYTIGGNVSGLSGTGLVLQNNGGDDLTIAGNGGFAFATPLENAAAYSVTVKTQPTNKWQTCTVNNGSGNVADAPITGISINCTTNTYKVKATVTGLAGTGLVLRNNGGNDLAIPSNGTFEFSQAVASGSPYAVTTFANPPSPTQTCTVTSSSGTIAGADVTATVNCVTYACGTGFEDTGSDVATVTCPVGSVIQSITFASYGLPTGSCGGFATAACNKANSLTVVQNACLGKNSCSVTASNAVFGGDPCPNQNKVLKIQAVCQ